MMMNNATPAPPQQHQYAFELNEHDVLCGRGSGPNDRVGNINFRNLVLSRKAEYLAAPSRDAKGRIATDIVDTIRGRGGRFLKKLSPAQAKEAGFKRGMAVYDLADEPTVLEKAKQTLRQNRAEFVQQIQNQKEGGGGLGGANAPSGATVAEAVANSAKKINAGNSLRNNRNGGNGMMSTAKVQLQENQLPTTPPQLQTKQNLSQQQQNQNSSSSMGSLMGSLNPIPLCDASVGLDSLQRPNLSARTAAHLNQTLFAASSDINSLTNPSIAGSNNSNNMMSLNRANLNQPGSTGSSGIGSGNCSILSMNTAELCAAMGGGFNNNNMSFNSFEQSTSSAQAIGNLLQEYQSKDEKTMMQQYEQLKAQQQVLQQQQQELTQQGFQPSIDKGEHQLQFRHQQLRDRQRAPQQLEGGQQKQNPSEVFASLLRQYDTLEKNLKTTQPHGQYKPERASLPASQQSNKTAHPQQQYEQYQQQQQQQQQQQPSHDVTNVTVEKVTSKDNTTVITDSFVKRLSAEDQNKLLQQFQQLQNAPQAIQPPSKSPPQVYEKTTAPLNEATQPSLLLNDYTKLRNDSKQLQASAQEQATQQQQSSSQLGSYPDSTATLGMGSYTKPLAPRDNYSYLDSSPLLKTSVPLRTGEAYLDSSAPLNDSQPNGRPSATLKGAIAQENPPLAVSTFKSERRHRRRSSRFSNSGRTSANSNMRLSNVEPADLNDDSLRLSFLTANQLARTLNDMSTMSMDLKQSATTKGNNNLDASMLSLMSMSLSEIAPDVMSNDHPGGYDSEGGIEKSPTPQISVVAEGSQEDLGFNASAMSLNVSLDEKVWNS